jgi:hypothetical protein
MLAHTSPAVAIAGGVLPPRRSAGLLLRRSILASDTEQLGELRADHSTAS